MHLLERKSVGLRCTGGEHYWGRLLVTILIVFGLHWACPTQQETVEKMGTYEFSKLEYVLPVFVTALQGAICWS